MAEIEIHHAHAHDDDAFGKKVSATVGVIGIVLAGVTIASHRAHTAAVLYRTEANDQWAFYQSKKIRENAAENAGLMLQALASDSSKATAAIAKLAAARERYAKDVDEIQAEAKAKEHETDRAEQQALRFDLGEGLLELGLVLTSLYFLAKRRVFPYFGVTAAALGTVLGATGLAI